LKQARDVMKNQPTPLQEHDEKRAAMKSFLPGKTSLTLTHPGQLEVSSHDSAKIENSLH
jgi:hypothetical protein